MKLNIKKLCIAILCVIALIGIDQYTKVLITNSFKLHEVKTLIPNLLYFTYYQNTGAAFSMFEGFGNIFFGIITVIALVFLVYFFGTADKLYNQIGYVLVFAGAIGNLIDRMTLGFVRDFIGVYIGSWAFPIFNFADICITCGFILLFVCMALEEVMEKRRWKKELSE